LETIINKNKRLVGLVITLILACTVAYNSPWVISYAGQTPMKQIADQANWGSLYNQKYVDISNSIQQQGQDYRGIILPYTHEAELYSPPKARDFQIVSQINQQISELIPEKMLHWSQTLGMLSIKTVAVKNTYNPNEIPIFPITSNVNQTLDSLKSDPNLNVLNQTSDYTILDNKNCLPLLYASNNYVLYDNVASLGYAFDQVTFADLPIFLKSGNPNSGLTVPSFINSDNYKLYAVGLTENQDSSAQLLTINNSSQTRDVLLQKIGTAQKLTIYSSTQRLHPSDQLKIPEPSLNQSLTFPDSTLNSTSMNLGKFGSFTLDFNIKIIQNGNYSFLGPRIVLDAGNMQYYIIIHDNGTLELAVMQNGVFESALITRFVGYSLRDPEASIDVKVQRVFDQVSVSVQGTQYLTFNTQSTFVNAVLTSENSISVFSDITIQRGSSFRLFAVRENPTKISYNVRSSSAEQSSITINSQKSDFALVSQYLYTNLTHIKIKSTEVEANVLFKAWIINQTAQNNQSTYISINTENREVTFASIGFAAVFSYLMLLFLIPSFRKKLIPIKNYISNKKQRGKQNEY
jgi:hypothetical protein